MPLYLILATATDVNRPMLTQDPTWLDRHLSTLAQFQVGLIAFYFTTHPTDVVLVVDAPDEVAVAKLGLALAGLGVFRIDMTRAYSEQEYRDLVAQPVPTVQTVGDLDTLRHATNELLEQHSDSNVTHLDDFTPTIIRTGGHPSDDPRADVALGAGEEATLKFAPGVSAIGFTYQQGLFNATFELDLADGSVATFSGDGFLPTQSFFGVVAPQGIDGLRLLTQGSFYLQDVYFYAAQSGTNEA